MPPPMPAGPGFSGDAPTEIESLRFKNDDDRSVVEQKVHDAFEKALKQDAQTITTTDPAFRRPGA